MDLNKMNDQQLEDMCDTCETYIYSFDGARNWCEGCRCNEAFKLWVQEYEENEIEIKRDLIGAYG